MAEDYALFAEFCRDVGRDRGLFVAEAKLVTTFVELHGLNLQSRILDAACGTGDVAYELWKTGYRELVASDGSSEMLSKWMPECEAIPRHQWDWARLGDLFGSEGTFDLVYLLGHSLPHARPDEIREIFGQVRRGLNAGGLFAFDMRSWERLADGRLVQGGREPGVWRLLQRVTVEGQLCWLMDTVTYGGDMQLVTYRLVDLRHPSGERLTTLRYHVFDWREAVEWLIAAGFERTGIEVTMFPGWPYTVVTCRA